MTEAFTLKGPSGNIAAELVFPPSFDRRRDRCTLVMLCHGFLGSMTAAPLGFLSRVVLESGCAVLRFDFDGYGKSEGAQEDNTVPGMLEDAKVVWQYASTLPFVDRIILLGHSQGGVVAAMLAGRLEKAGTPPAALVLLAPASVLKEYARKGKFFLVRCNPANPPKYINAYGFRIGREYILSAQTLPLEEEAAWFTGPVCLLHGSWDPIVPISYGRKFAALYRNCKFHRIWGTEHVFMFHRRKVRRLIGDFLKR